MSSPLPGNTSETARLMVDAPSFAVGWQEPVYIPNPAAGTSWSHVVDGRYYERLIAVSFTFTADAVVANRFLELFLADQNGVVITSVPCGGTVVASTSLQPALTVRGPAYAFNASGNAPGFIPDIMAPPGWKWYVTVFGEDVGDTITSTVLLMQRFPNDAAQITAGE